MTGEVSNPLMAFIALMAGVVVIVQFGWRAIVFLVPRTVRIEAEEPAEALQVPDGLGETWRELNTLGFVPLGSHSERPMLAPAVSRAHLYDAAHADSRVYASCSLTAEGVVRLTLFTPAPHGGVLTANFRWPASDRRGLYLAGALEGATAERLFKAHLRRVAELPVAPFEATLDGRVAVARAWYRGAHTTELRKQHFSGLMWALTGAALVVSAAAKLF